jgi:hypothetical protein
MGLYELVQEAHSIASKAGQVAWLEICNPSDYFYKFDGNVRTFLFDAFYDGDQKLGCIRCKMVHHNAREPFTVPELYSFCRLVPTPLRCSVEAYSLSKEGMLDLSASVTSTRKLTTIRFKKTDEDAVAIGVKHLLGLGPNFGPGLWKYRGITDFRQMAGAFREFASKGMSPRISMDSGVRALDIGTYKFGPEKFVNRIILSYDNRGVSLELERTQLATISSRFENYRGTNLSRIPFVLSEAEIVERVPSFYNHGKYKKLSLGQALLLLQDNL